MCGIAGIVGDGSSDEKLQEMLLSQKHRGPDYTGIYVEKKIVLGHNRLSIIDLSKEANQPFFDSENKYVLVFNGEIYNYLELKKELDYPFKTNSDTEVLLAAYVKWGDNCLHKLNGMFSFAIWDIKNKKLFAARDRFGVKPFYYHLKKGKLLFASEIKALFAGGVEKRPNEQVWANYFAFGSYGMPNETFWNSIEQLPGGHLLTFQNQKLTVDRWYDFEQRVDIDNHLSEKEVKEKYVALLRDSIRIRFRSDVPVGINLSGGLDSSTLLTFVNEEIGEKNIEAYTFYTDSKFYDELPWVEQMLDSSKNKLNTVLLTAEDTCSLVKEMSDFQDEPYGGVPTIAYSQIFRKAREQQNLVLQDGQGMDEQWAGYDYYASTVDSNIQGVTKSPFKKNILSERFKELAKKPVYPQPFKDRVLNLQYRDLFYTKIPRALRFNDRISMAYSTELREPFLDYRLVEFAFSLPLKYKINKGVHKALLRDIVSEHIPEKVSYAPKRPLQTPQREWLANELKPMVVEAIKGIEESDYDEWFSMTHLKEEWENYLQGDQDSSFHIWQWLNLYNLLIL